MYAVIDIKGQQHKVNPGEEILIDRMDATEGEFIEFDRVLMVGDIEDGEPMIGQPALEGARVLAEVVSHERGPKVETIRFNGPSETKIGHRQDYTRIRVREINPQ